MRDTDRALKPERASATEQAAREVAETANRIKDEAFGGAGLTSCDRCPT